MLIDIHEVAKKLRAFVLMRAPQTTRECLLTFTVVGDKKEHIRKSFNFSIFSM